MSKTEVLEQVRRLPLDEQRELVDTIEFELADKLSPEQAAELDRRAEDALKNPGCGTPWEQLRDEMLLKYRK